MKRVRWAAVALIAAIATLLPLQARVARAEWPPIEPMMIVVQRLDLAFFFCHLNNVSTEDAQVDVRLAVSGGAVLDSFAGGPFANSGQLSRLAGGGSEVRWITNVRAGAEQGPFGVVVATGDQAVTARCVLNNAVGRTFNAQIVSADVRSRTLNSQGLALWREGRYGEALVAYNRALDLRPDDPLTYNNRALLYVSTGNLPEALADANRAVELGRTANRLDTRGYVYLKLGRYQEALADYEEVFQLATQPSPYYHLGRGLALTGLSDKTRARPDLEKGLELAEGRQLDPQLEDLVGQARQALGR